MGSAVINQPTEQLSLEWEPGLCDRFTCLRECIAAGVYRNGLGNVAIDLDQAPGNLSVQLSSDTARHFSVDSLERYIEKTGDTQPIYFLIDKFLKDKEGKNKAAEMDAMLQAFKQMAPAMKKLGLV